MRQLITDFASLNTLETPKIGAAQVGGVVQGGLAPHSGTQIAPTEPTRVDSESARQLRRKRVVSTFSAEPKPGENSPIEAMLGSFRTACSPHIRSASPPVSCCDSVVVPKQTTEPIAAPDHAIPAANAGRRIDQPVIPRLVIPFRMVVGIVLLQRTTQGTLPEEDDVADTLVLD